MHLARPLLSPLSSPSLRLPTSPNPLRPQIPVPQAGARKAPFEFPGHAGNTVWSAPDGTGGEGRGEGCGDMVWAERGGGGCSSIFLPRPAYLLLLSLRPTSSTLLRVPSPSFFLVFCSRSSSVPPHLPSLLLIYATPTFLYLPANHRLPLPAFFHALPLLPSVALLVVASPSSASFLAVVHPLSPLSLSLPNRGLRRVTRPAPVASHSQQSSAHSHQSHGSYGSHVESFARLVQLADFERVATERIHGRAMAGRQRGACAAS
ncbi:hypothetical protein C8R44DRAFT_893856 [Mycena epipterygia]|nr:hypothetical protein C8R44DRAFT_893856 [Mycena epipterygia]